MTVTEQQASEKWCPDARVAAGYDTSPGNRFPAAPNPTSCRCIASDCMSWIWAEEAVERGGKAPSPGSKGYCGRARE